MTLKIISTATLHVNKIQYIGKDVYNTKKYYKSKITFSNTPRNNL